MKRKDLELITKQWGAWRILKALPFNGGPSSTRWVYLCWNATVGLCLLLMLYCLIHLARKTPPDIAALGVIAGLIASTITAGLTAATNAQNKKNIMTAADQPQHTPPPGTFPPG